MSIFNFCPASLLLPLRPTFLTYTSSQLLFMWMVLSSNVFVQPFIVFPSHILLQFQSYHQFSSLCPISIPAPYLISLSFEDLFQIPPIIPRKVNFYSSIHALQSHIFISFSHSTWCDLFSLWSSIYLPPNPVSSPLYFDVPEGDTVCSTGHKGCSLLDQVCGLSPSLTVAQR